MKRLYISQLALALALFFSACSESFLEKIPNNPNQTIAENAIRTPGDLQRLLISVYDVEANFLGGQYQNLMELLGDNLASPVNFDDYLQVYTRLSDIFNGTVSGVYRDAYIANYRANLMLSFLDRIDGLSLADRNRIEAEARFLRGLNYFMLARLWAHPFGYNNNAHLGIVIRNEADQRPLVRSSIIETYNAIINDLEFAANNLPLSNGIYATQWAAKAALAKVYFERNDYARAYDYANEIITQGPFTLIDSLNRFALGGNSEGIFNLVSFFQVNPDNSTTINERGGGFKDRYRSDINPNPNLRASTDLFLLATQDTADKRGKLWYRTVNAGASNQFYGVRRFDQNFMWVPLFHLTDMMLIRAECSAILGTNINQALDDVNAIRTRAGLNPISTSGVDLINAIRLERRLEMPFEGDRTMMIKRLGLAGQNALSRGAPWNCPGMILQFPGNESNAIGFQLNEQGGCN